MEKDIVGEQDYKDHFQNENIISECKSEDPSSVGGLDMFSNNFEYYITVLKNQRLEEIKDSNEIIYIPLKAVKSFVDTEEKDLMEEVKGFLSGSNKVLLISGKPGAGKTMFCRELEKHLWNTYSEQKYLPIFQTLSLAEEEKSVVKFFLEKYDLENYKNDLQKKKLLFIFDGYDEIKGQRNLYQVNFLSTFPNAKLIVTCREEYLNRATEDYKTNFITSPKCNQFEDRIITEFNRNQIEEYIKKYCESNSKKSWTFNDYIVNIEKVKDLEQLIKVPLLLFIIMEKLPDLASLDSKEQINKRTLYKAFIETWIRKMFKKNQIMETKVYKDLNQLNLDPEVLEKDCFSLISSISLMMYKVEKDALPMEKILECVDKEKTSYFENLFVLCPLQKEVRKGKHLSTKPEQSLIEYRFIHKSIMEYLVS